MVQVINEKWQLLQPGAIMNEPEVVKSVKNTEPYDDHKAESKSGSSKASNQCIYPSIIYLLVIITCLITQVSCHQNQNQNQQQQTQHKGKISSLLSKRLVESLLARDRWINVPTMDQPVTGEVKRPLNGLSGFGDRMPSRVSFSVGNLPALFNQLINSLNRITDRIGSRNTIRVHNAFRDLAWRLLARFSMPMPVIYELRRQHLYSVEDDLMNDAMFNKNTTKTLRIGRKISHDSLKKRQSDEDDDDNDNESLRDRLRLRLEDLVNLSRRSLFGRVVRLPSLFPFKRLASEQQQQQQHQQQSDNQLEHQTNAHNLIALGADNNKNNNNNNNSNNNNNYNDNSNKLAPLHKHHQQQQYEKKTGNGSSNSTGSIRKTISSLRARQRRKRKEADRQMIFINGKQYYVNDEGELKEWNNDDNNRNEQ